MEKRKIIIDTDVGDDIDDAYAIVLAMASPEFDLLGVTTVFKNVAQRAYIAKSLLSAGNRGEVPVYAGINRPLRQSVQAFEYEREGEDGLPVLRHYWEEMRRFRYEQGSAVDFILDCAERYPGEVTLVGIGPLTNLAQAYEKAPETFRKLRELVLMNGWFTDAYPEWNVMCDPEAARIVYKSGVPVRAVGVNCTQTTEICGRNLERLRSLSGACGDLLNRMLDIWFADNRRNCVMHDGLAIASMYGDFVSFERQNIYLPLEEGVRGYTLRLSDESSAAASAEVSVAVDQAAFLDSFLQRLIDFTDKNKKGEKR